MTTKYIPPLTTKSWTLGTTMLSFNSSAHKNSDLVPNLQRKRNKRNPPLASMLPVASLSQARNEQLQSTYTARVHSASAGLRGATASSSMPLWPHQDPNTARIHSASAGLRGASSSSSKRRPGRPDTSNTRQAAELLPLLPTVTTTKAAVDTTSTSIPIELPKDVKDVNSHLLAPAKQAVEALLSKPLSARSNLSLQAPPSAAMEWSLVKRSQVENGDVMSMSMSSLVKRSQVENSETMQNISKQLYPHYWKRATEKPPETKPKKKERTHISEAERCVHHFRDFLKQKYKTAAYAWHALDDDGNMNIGEIEFRRACQRVGYRGSISTIWKTLDSDGSGQITLLEVDPHAAAALGAFKAWGEQRFGGNSLTLFKALDGYKEGKYRARRESAEEHVEQSTADKQRQALRNSQVGRSSMVDRMFENMDGDGNGQLTFQELKVSCKAQGFQRLESLKVLYQMMDKDKTGYVTADEMAFLDKWKPPLYLMVDPDAKVTNDFKRMICENFDGSRLRAWCCALDRDRSMRVTWSEFEVACARFVGCVTDKQAASAWRFMDDDLSGWISLLEWDPDSYAAVLLFKKWAKEAYGSVCEAFRAIDADGGGTVSLRELSKVAEDCHADLPLLFKGLDFNDSGAWQLNKLRFMDDWHMSTAELSHLQMNTTTAKDKFKKAANKVKDVNLLGHKEVMPELNRVARTAATLVQSMETYKDFHAFCVEKYGSMLKAWCTIDPGITLELNVDDFESGIINTLEWRGDTAILWQYLDRCSNEAVSLLEFAPQSAVDLANLKMWSQEHLGLGDEAGVALGELGHPQSIDALFEAFQTKGYQGCLETFRTIGQAGGLESAKDHLQMLTKWQPPIILACGGPDESELQIFKDKLLEKYDDELLNAWVCRLDVEKTMYVSWKEFSAGYMKVWQQAGVFKSRTAAARAWRVLDPELAGWVSLKTFDEDSYKAVRNFKRWAVKTYGDVATIFNEVDKDGNGRLAFDEIASVAAKHVSNLDTVFHGLDAAGRGVWYQNQFVFLDEWIMD